MKWSRQTIDGLTVYSAHHRRIDAQVIDRDDTQYRASIHTLSGDTCILVRWSTHATLPAAKRWCERAMMGKEEV